MSRGFTSESNENVSSSNPFFSALKTSGMAWPQVMDRNTFLGVQPKQEKIKPFGSIFTENLQSNNKNPFLQADTNLLLNNINRESNSTSNFSFGDKTSVNLKENIFSTSNSAFDVTQKNNVEENIFSTSNSAFDVTRKNNVEENIFSTSNSAFDVTQKNNVEASSSSNLFASPMKIDAQSRFHNSNLTQSSLDTRPFTISTSTQSSIAFVNSSVNAATSVFSNSSTVKPTGIFGNSSTSQSAGIFGNSLTNQSSGIFGNSSTSQSTGIFGNSSTNQSTGIFGNSSTNQSTGIFGSSSTCQSTGILGNSSTSQSTGIFGNSSTSQSTGIFGNSSTSQSAGIFGNSSTSQSTGIFSNSTISQSSGIFVNSSTSQSIVSTSNNQSLELFSSNSTSEYTQQLKNVSDLQSTRVFSTSTTSQPSGYFGNTFIQREVFPATSIIQASELLISSSDNELKGIFTSKATSQSSNLFANAITTESLKSNPLLSSNINDSNRNSHDILKRQSVENVAKVLNTQNTKNINNPFAQSIGKLPHMKSDDTLTKNMAPTAPANPFLHSIGKPFESIGKSLESTDKPFENSGKPFDASEKLKNRIKVNIGKTTQPVLVAKPSNTIKIEGIPKKFYAKEFLLEFYSKFGVIVKVDMLSEKNNSALVKFINEASARDALNNGCVFEDDGSPVAVTFYKYSNEPKEILESEVPASDSRDNMDSLTMFDSPKKDNIIVKSQTTSKIQVRHQSFDDFQHYMDNFVAKMSKICCPDSRSKFDFLDQIDKEIRAGLTRDRNSFKAIKGTCQDMCPEKERHHRQCTNQLTFYESLSSTSIDEGDGTCFELDHEKILKEYSRSSADQDEPLPHELRPAPALKMTMDYIIHNIIDINFTDRSDWFDFVWNRTRAIRKDIIQQNLYCQTSVELIEKCVRFHIFCSHHLCEQDLHVFDPKINLENLTKCLQTLKHLYEDHYNQTGVPLKNESEFRCYQILLNLNDGDILREVMKFPSVIRKSKFVRFSLQVLAAVRDNNYIRFFKLLKLSSFLNGCLMHSYFNQIRANALRLMALAFSVPKADLSYPIADLQKLLAFSDNEDTEEFCSHYGFKKFENDILFNRSSYANPSELFAKRRSKIIMEKCIQGLGEIINGGELEELPAYIPRNSFDNEGYYVGDYHKMDEIKNEFEDSFEKTPGIDKFEENQYEMSSTMIHDSNDGDNYYNDADDDDGNGDEGIDDDGDDDEVNDGDENDKDYVQEVFSNSEEEDEVTDESQIMILREDINMFAEWFIQYAINETINNVLIETYDEFTVNMSQCEPVMNQLLAIVCITMTRDLALEVFAQEKRALKREEKAIEEQVTQELCEEMILAFADSYTRTLVESVVRLEEENVESQINEKVSIEMTHFIIDKVTLNISAKIAEDVYFQEKSEQKRQLQERGDNFNRLKLKHFFDKWKAAFKKKVNIRHVLEEFPPTALLKSTKDSLHLLRANIPGNKYDIHDAYDMLKGGESKTQSQIKSFVEAQEEMKLKLNRKIDIEKSLEKSLLQRVDILSDVCINILLETDIEMTQPQKNIVTCQVLHNKLRNTEEKNILYQSNISLRRFNKSLPTVSACVQILEGETPPSNYSGVLHVIEDNEYSQEYLPSERNDVPIAMIVLTDGNNMISSKDDFQFTQYISNKMQDIESCEKKVTEMICWLVERAVCFPVRKKCSVLNFIELCIKQFFFEKLQDYCRSYQEFNLPTPGGIDVINFFNESLKETKKKLEENFIIDGFDNLLVEKILQITSSLSLPLLWSSVDEDDWDQCYEASFKYARNLRLNSPMVLLNRINRRLDLVFLSNQCNEKIMFPWSEVIEICVAEKLSELQSIELLHSTQISYLPTKIKDCSQKMNKTLYPSIREQSICKSFLNKSIEYQKLVKQRKFERAHRLQDAVKDVNMQLNLLEETLQRNRRRKASQKLADSSSESYEEILNKSKELFESISEEKKHLLKTSNMKLKQYDSIQKIISPREERKVSSLETSVLSCLDDIAETRSTMSKSEEYWRKILLDK